MTNNAHHVITDSSNGLIIAIVTNEKFVKIEPCQLKTLALRLPILHSAKIVNDFKDICRQRVLKHWTKKLEEDPPSSSSSSSSIIRRKVVGHRFPEATTFMIKTEITSNGVTKLIGLCFRDIYVLETNSSGSGNVGSSVSSTKAKKKLGYRFGLPQPILLDEYPEET